MEQRNKIIKNIAFILALDLILFPLAMALYLFHGFHIVHVVMGIGYLYGLVLIYDTVKLLYEHIRIVNNPSQDETQSDIFHGDTNNLPEEPSDFCCEGDYDCTGCTCKEDLKPEMKQAMDEVFGINKK